jgi:hypothetical protein
MIATVTDEDVYEALTEHCSNGPDGKNDHGRWDSCTLCIDGKSLNMRGRQLADLMAKYLKQPTEA